MTLKVVECLSGDWCQTKAKDSEKKTRGRKATLNYEKLLSEVKTVIGESLFKGEGYKNVWHRLRRRGINADKGRVNRVMRENKLLSPYRHDPATMRKRTHNGKIVAQMLPISCGRQMARSSMWMSLDGTGSLE